MNFKEIFNYNEGKLFWAVDRHKLPAGDEAGWEDKDGYLLVTLPRNLKPEGGRVFKAHRIIWEMFNGDIPEGMLIDHIDGNKKNNKLENLRLATYKQNFWNRKPVESKVASKGVQLSENGRYRARIRHPNGQRVSLGNWETEAEASAAYQTAAMLLFGDFART